jgi:hypothetical protein
MWNKLCVLILCSSIIGFCSVSKTTAESGKSDVGSVGVKETSDKFVAYYFHGNFRCNNCRKIEQYSRESVELYFSQQLKTGELTFNVINTDEPGNEHFVEDYQLYTRSLIIAEFKDGKQVKWKNLAKVWDYLNDKEKFYEYVKSEIQNYLEHL